MMRWAVRCCPVIPDDDGAFNDPVLSAKIAAAQSAQRLWVCLFWRKVRACGTMSL